MKALGKCLIFAGLVLGLEGVGCADNSEPKKWESPRHDYSIMVSNTSDPFSYRLAIFHKTTELAHYTFDTNLVSIYWSPEGSYVAFNNWYGHRCWAIWIISLKDGSLIRVNGKRNSADYDRYEDYEYLPNTVALAKPQITAIYPGYPNDTDRRGEGHITIIYGWKDDNTLQMYDEVVLDNLYENEHVRLSIYSLLKVQESGLSVSHFSVQKTPYFSAQEGRPSEVVKVLGY